MSCNLMLFGVKKIIKKIFQSIFVVFMYNIKFTILESDWSRKCITKCWCPVIALKQNNKDKKNYNFFHMFKVEVWTSAYFHFNMTS